MRRASERLVTVLGRIVPAGYIEAMLDNMFDEGMNALAVTRELTKMGVTDSNGGAISPAFIALTCREYGMKLRTAKELSRFRDSMVYDTALLRFGYGMSWRLAATHLGVAGWKSTKAAKEARLWTGDGHNLKHWFESITPAGQREMRALALMKHDRLKSEYGNWLPSCQVSAMPGLIGQRRSEAKWRSARLKRGKPHCEFTTQKHVGAVVERYGATRLKTIRGRIDAGVTFPGESRFKGGRLPGHTSSYIRRWAHETPEERKARLKVRSEKLRSARRAAKEARDKADYRLRNPANRMTDEVRRAMVRDLVAGMTGQDAAKKYGFCETTVSIVNRSPRCRKMKLNKKSRRKRVARLKREAKRCKSKQT